MITSKLTSDNHAHCDVTALIVVTSLLHDDTKQLTCPDNIAKKQQQQQQQRQQQQQTEDYWWTIGRKSPL